MAMVFENAGGQAVNSKMTRMLEVQPEHIHDRSGIFLGSYDEAVNKMSTGIHGGGILLSISVAGVWA